MRSIIIVVTLLCFTGKSALAKYRVFESGDTNVIINGQNLSYRMVRNFERRCMVSAAAGRFWLNEDGTFGPVGGRATYNVFTCRSLMTNARPETKESCTMIGDGFICGGPNWRTVH